jgi:hypothetical protein
MQFFLEEGYIIPALFDPAAALSSLPAPAGPKKRKGPAVEQQATSIRFETTCIRRYR